MSQKAPIAWHHGQFLQPQHFQLADQYQQSIIAQLLPIAQQYFWGFSQLEIDLAALERGQLIINQAKFFWQDGSCIQLHENAVIINRTIPSFQDSQSMEVYLGLKRLEEGKANAIPESSLQDTKARYVIDPETKIVADLYQNGPEAKVTQLKYVFKLFFYPEVTDIQGYDLLPLLKINQDQKHFSIAADYSPSIVQLAAYPALWENLKHNRNLLIQAFNFALTYKPNQEWYQLHLGESELGKYLLAQSLHRLIPSLIDTLDRGTSHPFLLYGKLRDAIHELSFYLTNKIHHEDYGYLYQILPPYEHHQPHVSLLAGFERLQSVLNQILSGPQFSITLKRKDDHYEGFLPSDFLAGNDRFYLVMYGKQNLTQDIMQHMMTSAKLTSAEAIHEYIQHAIPGVPLSYLPSRPVGAPDIPGALYFSIDCQHPQWATIVQKANVGFYPGNMNEPLTIDLVSARGL